MFGCTGDLSRAKDTNLHEVKISTLSLPLLSSLLHSRGSPSPAGIPAFECVYFNVLSSLVDCGIRFEVDPHWPHSGNGWRGFNTTVLSSALVSCHLHHLHRVIHAATPWPPLNIKDPRKGSHYVVGAGRRYGPCAVEGAPILRFGQLIN